MGKVNPASTQDLLNFFSEFLSNADLSATRLKTQISGAIARKRQQMDMTQAQFAEFLGVRQPMVSTWENDDYNFTLEMIANIFDKLNLSIDLLIEEVSENSLNSTKLTPKQESNFSPSWNEINTFSISKSTDESDKVLHYKSIATLHNNWGWITRIHEG